MERHAITSTVPVSMDVLKGQQAILARKDANQDIMGGIAVTVVVKAALLPNIVTELQDDVKVGVNKDGQETHVIKLEQPTKNLVHAQKATAL